MPSIHLWVSAKHTSSDTVQGKVDKLNEALKASQRQAKQADSEAQVVMNFEMSLASASMSRVQMRDPRAVWHKMNLPQLAAIAPRWPWEAYFRQRNEDSVDL